MKLKNFIALISLVPACFGITRNFAITEKTYKECNNFINTYNNTYNNHKFIDVIVTKKYGLISLYVRNYPHIIHNLQLVFDVQKPSVNVFFPFALIANKYENKQFDFSNVNKIPENNPLEISQMLYLYETFMMKLKVNIQNQIQEKLKESKNFFSDSLGYINISQTASFMTYPENQLLLDLMNNFYKTYKEIDQNVIVLPIYRDSYLYDLYRGFFKVFSPKLIQNIEKVGPLVKIPNNIPLPSVHLCYSVDPNDVHKCAEWNKMVYNAYFDNQFDINILKELRYVFDCKHFKINDDVYNLCIESIKPKDQK